MKMKRTLYICIAATAAAASLLGCRKEYVLFDGPSAIAFSDTSYVCPVQQSGEPFGIDIAATSSSAEDRTFVVEAVPGKSSAVFGHHYTIENQTVTIKAGERAAKVYVKGIYDSVSSEDEPYVTLRLVGVEDSQWEFNSQETKVYLKKICPFDIHDFTGKCTVMSSFLISYANVQERTAYAEIVEGEENTIVIKGMFEDGHDVKFRFDLSDILNPTMHMVDETVVGDTRTFMNYIWGNGQLLGSEVSGYDAELDVCEKYVTQYMLIRVDGVGTVGMFINIIEFGVEN